MARKPDGLHEELYEFYKISPMREGVLCWYPFKNDASVLDLSSGILTELLRNRCGNVVSESEDRGGFDYIVLLDPGDFSTDALIKLREKLNNHGRLLLAYENPFALRYWSGKPSNKKHLPYYSLFGLDGRPGAAELCSRLELAGFEGQKWYYPLTDHWFAREIYSDSYLPNEFLNQRFYPYITDYRTLQFDERNLYRDVIRGGAFEFMCGAYLIEARANEQDKPCVVDYVAVTAYREPAKRFATIVRSDGMVDKLPLHPDGLRTLKKIQKTHDELINLGVNTINVKIENNRLRMPRIEQPTLWDYWASKLSNGTFDESEMTRHYDRIHEAIRKAGVTGKCFWELVPANCFYDEHTDELTFFDQEYYWEGVSTDIAMTRALMALFFGPIFRSDSQVQECYKNLKERYGLVEHWKEMTEIVQKKTRSEVFGTHTAVLDSMTGRTAGRLKEERKRVRANLARLAEVENVSV